MANCKKCKCKKDTCACASNALPIAPPCGQGTVDCPDQEACSETFSAGCIVYTGDSIVDLGINKGDRVDNIIQRLAMMITNPGCIEPTSLCQASLNLRSTYIYPTIIQLAWDSNISATQYNIEYKLASDTVWIQSAAILPGAYPIASIGNLSPDEEYYIRVKSTCASGICYSLTISVTTLEA